MALIVSVSGIRGIVGTELTAEIAARYAVAFGKVLGGGSVLVGRDSRPTGEELSQAVIAGLSHARCGVMLAGILPTPTCGFLVRELQCAGGVMVTASHNPAPYNGMKLFGPDGAVLSATQGAEIHKLFNALGEEQFAASAIAMQSVSESSLHLERVLKTIDVTAIRDRRFQVLIDGNGGAGGPLAMDLLGRLGCGVLANNCTPDGIFRHDPEPTPDHLRDVAELVRAMPGAIGFALDPDSDRLALIDESGRCLSEELTLALAAQERLVQDRGPVVINLSSSRVTEDIANAAGVPCHRSAVGEANVVAKMREVGAIIGGEGNGGVIDPRVGWVRDPFIGMALILSQMARTGKTIAQLANELPQYAIQKEKFAFPRERLPELFESLTTKWPDAAVDRQDGIRFDWPDRWVQVRGSNTEPVVRVISEAPTPATAIELCREVSSVVG